MRVFAVTYTYNDATLANALLADLPRWSTRPDIVLVVDDGSAPPYAPPSELRTALNGTSLQVLRLDPNQGPAGAKRAGLNAAAASGAEVILSLDADIRPHPTWLATALPYLADPGIGLVGAEFAHGLSGDILSRYLRAFFTPPARDNAVPFLRAGLWLMRRDTWLDMDGFGDFVQTTHEDLYFCLKIAAAGLRMQAVNSKPVSQVRRLHRCAHMRREMAYLGRAINKMTQNHGLEKALLPLTQQASLRLRRILEQGEAEFLYLEIFKYAALLAWLQNNSATASERARMIKGLLSICLNGLTAYPNTLALLREDLAAVGLPQDQPCPGPLSILPSPLPGPEELHPLLLKLEFHGVKQLNQEERSISFDAHYLTPPDLSLPSR